MSISLFSVLSIEYSWKKERVELRTSKVLKERKFLLNQGIYISADHLVEKKQYTFWAFAYGEKVNLKSDNTTS